MSDPRGPRRGRVRLDSLLAERGLFPSRSRAAVAVMAGEVRVGRGERRAAKPSELVDPTEPIAVSPARAYVSRGGVKLANALEASGVEVDGRRALDVGSSTGGFTDCLLQRGAKCVVAVDVGHGLLDYGLRNDPRVRVLERVNARQLTPELLSIQSTPSTVPAQSIPSFLPAQVSRPTLSAASAFPADSRPPDLACVDVSFISLTLVLGPVLSCLAATHDVLALIKPQFELGRARVAKGRGVVRDPGDRREALLLVGRFALARDASVLGYHSSGLPGPKGNRETFIHLAQPAHPHGAANEGELERMARTVEP